jgi:hypothetical protein
MKILLSCLLLLASAWAQNADCTLKGGSDLPAGKQKKLDALLLVTPDQAAVGFEMALDYAEAGNDQKALSLLEDALAQTPWIDPSTEPAFKPLYDCAAFQTLVTRVQHKYPPVAAARVVQVIPQKDLIPEGLASDPTDGTLYLSSIFHRKIVKIAPDGKISDFITEAHDGLLGVLGIKVDPRDRSVWAASERSGQAALFHFDRNGKTLGQFAPRQPANMSSTTWS